MERTVPGSREHTILRGDHTQIYDHWVEMRWSDLNMQRIFGKVTICALEVYVFIILCLLANEEAFGELL